jgi:death on curing protein
MIFLTVEEVMNFHMEIIRELGGAHGIREMGLLISAVEMPKAAMFGEFLHVTIYEKAAAYLFHIVRNHPFLDGNKRSGLVTALTFLEVNGVVLEYDENQLEELVIQVADGKADKAVVADFFLTNHPVSQQKPVETRLHEIR